MCGEEGGEGERVAQCARTRGRATRPRQDHAQDREAVPEAGVLRRGQSS